MFFRMVYKSGQIFLPFCHNSCVWQMDGQTEFSSLDRVCIPCSVVIRGQKGMASVTWPTFKFWDRFYIYGISKATNFKFGMQIDYKEYFWWILNSKDSKPMHARAHGHRDSLSGEQKKAPAFQPRGQRPECLLCHILKAAQPIRNPLLWAHYYYHQQFAHCHEYSTEWLVPHRVDFKLQCSITALVIINFH